MKYLKLFENFKLKNFLKELDNFNLDKNDYAIFGSGPLAIRGIVEPTDLDIIIKKNKYPYNKDPIVIGNLEFSKSWPGIENTDDLIDDSEIINNYPFVKLKYVKKYKDNLHRDKDINHLYNLKKYLKSFESFNYNKIFEKIITDQDNIMDNINYKKINFIDDPFNFNIKNFSEDYKLEQLRNNPDFNDNLSKHDLFISEFNNTKSFDTFIVDDIKYILIHKRLNRNMNKLEKLGDPIYIIIQIKDINNKWKRDNIKIYKIIDNFNNFYKNLISKTIQLTKNDNNYIYISNGKNWILKNSEKENKIFKKILTIDEIRDIIKQKNITIKII